MYMDFPSKVPDMTDRHFLFLIASARPGGNTEQLTERAAAALPSDVQQTWLKLWEHPLPTFEDHRHDGIDRDPRGEHEELLLQATLAATDVVIASPLYWYSVSASAKLYLDYWSGWMTDDALEFKPKMAGKKLWGTCALSEELYTQAEPLVGMLHRSADYMSMGWGGVLLGNGSAPGQVLRDADALGQASRFFDDSPGTVG